MKPRGRPRASNVPRTEQLRLAKQAQRNRLRAAGMRTIQIDLAAETAEKLKVARGDPQFGEALDALLDRLVIRVSEFPQLRDLAWNRADDLITAHEAFGLYERNWRFVDVNRLDPRERALIERLTDTYGAGLINA
jgi:hypothetical protein